MDAHLRREQPRVARHVLLERRDICEKTSRSSREIRHIAGASLMTAVGLDWAAKRQVLHPAFKANVIGLYHDVMEASTASALERWRREVPDGGVLDMAQEMMRLTYGIVSSALLGEDLDQTAHEVDGALRFMLAHVVARLQGPSVPLDRPTPGNRRFRRARAPARARRRGRRPETRRASRAARSARCDASGRVRCGAGAERHVVARRGGHAADLARRAAGAGRGTLGDHDIPRGANVAVAIWLLHRHPEFWPEPERFDPERFRDSQQHGRPGDHYLPFGLGPRTCLGLKFAVHEALIVLARSLTRLRVAPVKGATDAVPVPGVTLRPRGGLPLGVRWRD